MLHTTLGENKMAYVFFGRLQIKNVSQLNMKIPVPAVVKFVTVGIMIMAFLLRVFISLPKKLKFLRVKE